MFIIVNIYIVVVIVTILISTNAQHTYFHTRYIKELRSGDIPLPNDLRGPKGQIVFANIEAIYEWHREWVVIITI